MCIGNYVLNSDKKDRKFLALLIEDQSSTKCLYNIDGTYSYFIILYAKCKRKEVGSEFLQARRTQQINFQ